MNAGRNYRVLMHRAALMKAGAYLETLQQGGMTGKRLQSQLQGRPLEALTPAEFVGTLLGTKQPQIFAESAVIGDGTDWNLTELSLLGDISVAVPVMVFDDGRHQQPQVHRQPFEATLLYTPGALLRNGHGHPPADWPEVTKNGKIDPAGYHALYERRLLPGFLYANDIARTRGKDALVTIPGLGCGMFAGPFAGHLESLLATALKALFEKHGPSLTNIKVVYYDPYRNCGSETTVLGGISFRVRPLTLGNQGRPQLCKPEAYAEAGDFFTYHELFSIVAWDHVSWPGNDFYGGSRQTDDGVKAAATDSMAVMTGIEGTYDPVRFAYCPPSGFATWGQVVERHHLQFEVGDKLIVLP